MFPIVSVSIFWSAHCATIIGEFSTADSVSKMGISSILLLFTLNGECFFCVVACRLRLCAVYYWHIHPHAFVASQTGLGCVCCVLYALGKPSVFNQFANLPFLFRDKVSLLLFFLCHKRVFLLFFLHERLWKRLRWMMKENLINKLISLCSGRAGWHSFFIICSGRFSNLLELN